MPRVNVPCNEEENGSPIFGPTSVCAGRDEDGRLLYISKMRPDIQYWIEENCDGAFKLLPTNTDHIILFELAKDAVAFKLRWL